MEGTDSKQDNCTGFCIICEQRCYLNEHLTVHEKEVKLIKIKLDRLKIEKQIRTLMNEFA